MWKQHTSREEPELFFNSSNFRTCFHRFYCLQVTAWTFGFFENQALIAEGLNQGAQRFTGKHRSAQLSPAVCSPWMASPTPPVRQTRLLFHRTAFTKMYCWKFSETPTVQLPNVSLICFPEENILPVTLKISVKCLPICTDKTGGNLL